MTDEQKPFRKLAVGELERILVAHAQWLSSGEQEGVQANLSGADLRYANLRGAKLRRADLDGAKLRNAELKGADLRKANLAGAKLMGANLEGANLEGANLREADLREADLKGAKLMGADIEGANLEGANLTGTIFWLLSAADFKNDSGAPALAGADVRKAEDTGPATKARFDRIEAQRAVARATDEVVAAEARQVAFDQTVARLRGELEELGARAADTGEAKHEAQQEAEKLRESLAAEESRRAQQEEELVALRENEQLRTDEKNEAVKVEKSLEGQAHTNSELARLREEAKAIRADVTAGRIPLLDADAQRARRNLVAGSAVAIAAFGFGFQSLLAKTLGLDLARADPTRLRFALGALVIYLGVAFAIKVLHSIRVGQDDDRRVAARTGAFRHALPEHQQEDPMIKSALDDKPRHLWAYRSAWADVGLPALLALVALVLSAGDWTPAATTEVSVSAAKVPTVNVRVVVQSADGTVLPTRQHLLAGNGDDAAVDVDPE